MPGPSAPFVDLYFEDVPVGAEFETAAHTVTESDVLAFASLVRIHPEGGEGAESGRPAAHDMYGFSLMGGLMVESGVYERATLASLAWENVRFSGRVRAGDTVRARIRFAGKRDSRRPDRGVVTEAVSLVNQADEVVISAEHITLLQKRSTGSDAT